MAVFAVSSPAAEPDGFRGMKWGISVEDANRAIKNEWQKRRESGEIIFDTLKDYPDGERKWKIVYRDKIGQVPVNIVLGFLDGRFLSVLLTFESDGFGTIDSAFKSRYGKPSIDRAVPLSNAFGATFIDQQRKWIFKGVEIGLTKHADAKTGGAQIATREWLKFENAEETKKKAKAAKDL